MRNFPYNEFFSLSLRVRYIEFRLYYLSCVKEALLSFSMSGMKAGLLSLLCAPMCAQEEEFLPPFTDRGTLPRLRSLSFSSSSAMTTVCRSAMKKSISSAACDNGPSQGQNGPFKGNNILTSSQLQPELLHDSSEFKCFNLSLMEMSRFMSSDHTYKLIPK